MSSSAPRPSWRVRYGKGEITSRAVVDAHIAHARRLNPALNAIAADRFEAALRRGRRSRRARRAPAARSAAVPRRALHDQGVVRGRGHAERLRLVHRAELRAQLDAPAVPRLRAAGAIPLGVTNTSEAHPLDRVVEPRLGPHRQRLRPEPDGGRIVRRRGRRRRRGLRADRPWHRHRRLDPAAGVLQRRVRPQADAAASSPTAATTRAPNERGHRPLLGSRPAGAPRGGPDAVPAHRRGARDGIDGTARDVELGDPAERLDRGPATW